MKYEDQRKETPFATRDNMLDIRDHVTELTFRGFGKKKRKMPREPRNFGQWSEKSRERWISQQEELLARQEEYDRMFIEDESKVVRDLCRQIVFLIDRANTLNPQTVHECDIQRDLQNEAIGLCNNLQREMNHIAETIPCNRNFLAILSEDIDREIDLIRGWRKSCVPLREKAMILEMQRREKAEKKAALLPACDPQETRQTTE